MNNSPDPIRLFATDIEDTLIGDDAATERFRRAWDSINATRRPLLVYNTGRSVADTRWLILERRLPDPEFIIGALGTELDDPVDAKVAMDYHESIASGWDIISVNRIVERIPGVRRQPSEFLNPWKSSWHWHRASAAEVEHLRGQFAQAGLKVSVRYSNDVYLDVFPFHAGKANALAWLCRRIGVPLEAVLIAGASANNRGVFALPGVQGLLVGNAARELFVTAGRFNPLVLREPAADGVLAGLRHFGVLDTAGRSVTDRVLGWIPALSQHS